MNLEQGVRIELTLSAWKAELLPIQTSPAELADGLEPPWVAYKATVLPVELCQRKTESPVRYKLAGLRHALMSSAVGFVRTKLRRQFKSLAGFFPIATGNIAPISLKHRPFKVALMLLFKIAGFVCATIC